MQKIILMFLAICVITLPTYAAIDTNNIMGMWLFERDSGGIAVDSSENGNDGTIHGAKLVDGVFGKALEFDGTDDWVEVPHAKSLGFPAGTSFSITLHYKGTKVGGSLVGKNYEDTSQAKPWYLIWNGGSGNTISIYLRTTDDQNSRINGTVDVSDDDWHFIAAVADADAKKISLASISEYTLENITAMWLFDDGEGTIATDSSLNDNDGTIHGAQWVDGRFGKALEFNGTDTWVEVPHSDSVVFEAGTSFTLTVHFKGTSVGGSLAGKNYEDKTQATPWYMLWNGGADGKLAFFLRDGSNASFRMNSTTDINDDQWHFIAGRADAETGKATLWIDGTQEAEYDFNKDSGYGTAEGVFHIGRHFDRYTAGIIDEVALFNVALTEDDMQSIMNDGLVNLTAVEADGKLATTWGNVKKRSIK